MCIRKCLDICPAHVSKHSSNVKKVLFLMISNGERWHYVAVKALSALIRGITSKHVGDFYCLNCLYYFRAQSKLDSHKKVCENKDFCNIGTPFEDTKILEFNQYQKSDKALFINDADIEC